MYVSIIYCVGKKGCAEHIGLASQLRVVRARIEFIPITIVKYFTNSVFSSLVKMCNLFPFFHFFPIPFIYLFIYQQFYGNYFKFSNISTDHNSRELQNIIQFQFQFTNTINNYSLFHLVYLLICCSIFVVYHGCTAYRTGYWVERKLCFISSIAKHSIKLLANIKTSQAAPVMPLEKYLERV